MHFVKKKPEEKRIEFDTKLKSKKNRFWSKVEIK